MSNTVKGADSASTDPLAEALDRLERSMAGTQGVAPAGKKASPAGGNVSPAGANVSPAGKALPAKRPRGVAPKPLVPEGTPPPQQSRSAPAAKNPPSSKSSESPQPPANSPRPSTNPASVESNPVVAEKLAEIRRPQNERVPRKERSAPAPLEDAPEQGAQKSEKVATPKPPENKKPAAQPAPVADKSISRPASESVSRPAKKAAEVVEAPVTKQAATAPVAPATPEKPRPGRQAVKAREQHQAAPPPQRPQAMTPPAQLSADFEDEFVAAIEDDRPTSTVSRRSNRRGRTGRSPWFAALVIGGVQLFILGLAALVAWPLMKAKLADEASSGVQGGREISTALINRVGEGERQIADLENQLKEMSKRLSVTPKDAWNELEFLGSRNQLVALGDRSIHSADRAALEKLQEMATSSPEERIRTGALAEILRVKTAYQMGLRSSSHTLPVGQLFPALKGRGEMELTTDQLIKVMHTQDRPDYRVKAAYLLADRRGGKAADALASSVASDTDLDVVREAAMTFCEMTGYRTSDLFDSQSLMEWWQTNSTRVKAYLGG